MQIYSTESSDWLTRAYLIVGDDKKAVLVDGNGVAGPLLDRVRDEGLDVEFVILTHHHGDHAMIDAYETAGYTIAGLAETAELLPATITKTIADGDVLNIGSDIEIEAWHTPGHCSDHLALLVNGTDIFTADVLFKGTVGGTRGPGATGIDDLRASLDRFMTLPPETRVHPGHKEPSTIGDELASNPFVKAFRESEPPAGEPVKVGGEPAELLLWGPDYDGTNKAWVRFPDGSEAVTGGSQVQREQ
jgi:glyoxylase-like metal-dependent hydrolase (beta-lactamase superfamily II)